MFCGDFAHFCGEFNKTPQNLETNESYQTGSLSRSKPRTERGPRISHFCGFCGVFLCYLLNSGIFDPSASFASGTTLSAGFA